MTPPTEPAPLPGRFEEQLLAKLTTIVQTRATDEPASAPARERSRRLSWKAFAAVGLCTLVAGSAVAATTIPGGDVFIPGSVVGPSATPVQHVPDQIAETYGLFRSAPAAPAQDADAAPTRDGFNAGLARSVDTENGRVTVIPGATQLCLEWGPAITCTPAGDAAKGGLKLGQQSKNGPTTYVGLVPDGVVSVTITAKDGTVQRAEVHDNVWTLKSARGRMAFQTARGATPAATEEVAPPRAGR